MTNELEQAAHQWAERGLRVFPIRPLTKSEYTNDKGLAGREWYRPGATRHEATTDQAVIAAWWTQITKANIGVLIDALHVCVDVDKRNSGLESAREFNWDATYTEATASGGYHLVYQLPSPTRTSPFVLAQGIDILTAGSVFVAAPSVLPTGKYKIIRPYAIATSPDWLMEVMNLHLPLPPQPSSSSATDITHITAYGRAALEREAARIASLPEGQRAYMLNTITYHLAALIPSGALTEEAIITAMEQATREWKQPGKVKNIVQRAIRAGRTHPRNIEPRQ
jgi:hypothetical protein